MQHVNFAPFAFLQKAFRISQYLPCSPDASCKLRRVWRFVKRRVTHHKLPCRSILLALPYRGANEASFHIPDRRRAHRYLASAGRDSGCPADKSFFDAGVTGTLSTECGKSTHRSRHDNDYQSIAAYITSFFLNSLVSTGNRSDWGF